MTHINVEVSLSSLVKAWGAAYGYRYIGIEYQGDTITARVYIPFWKHLLFPKRTAKFCETVQRFLPEGVTLIVKPVRKVPHDSIQA